MTTGGWVVMILSVGGATAFFAFCIIKVLILHENRASHEEPEDENLDVDDD